jgi:hypothetical protein
MMEYDKGNSIYVSHGSEMHHVVAGRAPGGTPDYAVEDASIVFEEPNSQAKVQ